MWTRLPEEGGSLFVRAQAVDEKGHRPPTSRAWRALGSRRRCTIEETYEAVMMKILEVTQKIRLAGWKEQGSWLEKAPGRGRILL